MSEPTKSSANDPILCTWCEKPIAMDHGWIEIQAHSPVVDHPVIRLCQECSIRTLEAIAIEKALISGDMGTLEMILEKDVSAKEVLS